MGILPIGSRKEKEALAALSGNARSVLEVVKKFEELAIAFFAERDLKKARAIGGEISALETEADKGRRNFMQALHGGAFLPALRGDLARLAERVDDVADTAEGAMRAILLRERLLGALASAERKRADVRGVTSGLVEMARLTTRTVETLCGAVEALAEDVDAASVRANEVDKLEHEVDLLEEGILNDLYEREGCFDPVSVAQLADIIRRTGNITDRAEDASDLIQIASYVIRA